MNDSLYPEVEELAVPLPITRANWAIAQQFASEQPTAEKAEQVRLNTLAVLAVNDYLKWLGIETSLESSDSWIPVMRLCGNIADLEVVNIGRLECRPLAISKTQSFVPAEVWQMRIGYVFVRVDDENRTANLIGFLPSVTSEEVALDRLQAPETLIDRLEEFNPQKIEPSVETRSPRINLGHWIEGIVQLGWQTVDTLLNATELTPEMSFRSAETLDNEASEDLNQEGKIRHGKVLNLESLGEENSVLLLVEIDSLSDEIIEICVRVYPQKLPSLPAEIKLQILDESNAIFQETISRSTDNYIQLQFSGKRGEKFSIKIRYGNDSQNEDFEI